jgi:serine/threonine protein phosphatase PrpC
MASLVLNENRVLPALGEHTIKIKTKVAQLSKGQDRVRTGQGISVATCEHFYYACVFDGHGTDKCIRIIDRITQERLDDIMESSYPVRTMAMEIKRMWGPQHSQVEWSGSTMGLVKVFENRLECVNCGDSQVMVFVNGILVHFTVPHNSENPVEMERLLAMGATTSPASQFELVSPNRMKTKSAKYINFPDGPRLAIGQALGHNDATGYTEDTVIIPILPTDLVRVVGGSDGLWDLVMEDREEELAMLRAMECDEILQTYSARWTQVWEMEVPNTNPIKIDKCRYRPVDCDDVAVFVVDMLPIIVPEPVANVIDEIVQEIAYISTDDVLTGENISSTDCNESTVTADI